MHSSRIVIPINGTAIATALWLASVGLMVGDTYGDWRGDGTLARWSLLAAVAAAALSVGVMITHARGVVLDVMSWEHKQIRREVEEHANAGLTTPILRKQGG